MEQAQLDRDELLVLQPPQPRVLEELDRPVRLLFTDIVPAAAPSGSKPSSLYSLELLERSAHFLEQRQVVAGIMEAMDQLGVQTFAEFEERSQRVVRLAQQLTRVDPIAVLVRDPEYARIALEASKSGGAFETLPENMLSSVVRAMSSLIEFCPIEDLVELGETLEREDLGHRCRDAYDWLKAFVRRHARSEDEPQRLIGRAYVEGRLSLNEVSRILAWSRPETARWLERMGYARDLTVIRLTDEEREERLAKIHRDRVERKGRPVHSEELAARDVIATQRIEDVDASPWIKPHPIS